MQSGVTLMVIVHLGHTVFLNDCECITLAAKNIF